MTKTIKRLRFSWIMALGLLIIWLLAMAIVPWGKITYQTDFKKPSFMIGQFLPADRVITDNGFPKLIAEPVYFTLFTPRAFSQAVVTIDFSGPVDLAKVGVCRDKALWNYDLKNFDVKKIETLANGDLRTQLRFDLVGACREKSKYSFMISAPELNKQVDKLVVKKIKVELFGLNLYQFIYDRF